MPSTSGLSTECSNEEGPTCLFWRVSLIVERVALHRCPLCDSPHACKGGSMPRGYPGIWGTVGTGWQVKRKDTSHGRRSCPILQTERAQRYINGCLTVNGMLGTNLGTIAPRSKYQQYHRDKWEDAPSKLQLWCGWKEEVESHRPLVLTGG